MLGGRLFTGDSPREGMSNLVTRGSCGLTLSQVGGSSSPGLERRPRPLSGIAPRTLSGTQESRERSEDSLDEGSRGRFLRRKGVARDLALAGSGPRGGR